MRASTENQDNIINFPPLTTWGLKTGSVTVIAGPCSAESSQQIMATARGLAAYDIAAFRAGVWKPRTNPGSFEGIGADALRWLRDAGDAIGKPVCVETALPLHVDLCLKHKIDILWIGARTSGDPFSVQAIADSLSGVDIPVMVKNPCTPDLGLWIGAVERLMRAGLMRIAAIHRGFATSQPGIYRNEPLWRIPLELRRRLPSLPIICDPSHLCGSTDLIFSIAQEALDLLFDGLMIEVHADPPHALSDARQQLTPAQFGELLASLRVKSREPADSSIKSEIEHLRREIDALDTGLVELLAHRMEIVRRIGALKRKNAVAVFQPERWEEIVKTRLDANAASSLDRQFLLEVLELIHEEAIRQQTLPAPDGAEAGSGGTAK